MESKLQERLLRANYLLRSAANAAMATVNEDGTPHNSPYFCFFSDDLAYAYWASDPRSVHCQNAIRTSHIFVVIYEANAGGGLYMRATGAQQLLDEGFDDALNALNMRRASFSKKPLESDYYQGESKQRLFRARVVELSVNWSERDDTGRVIRDVRRPVSASAILNAS